MRIAFIGTREIDEPFTKKEHFEIYLKRLVELSTEDIVCTGAAVGCDQVAAKIHLRRGGSVELFLPWSSYEEKFVRRAYDLFPEKLKVRVLRSDDTLAYESVKTHPASNKLKPGAIKLHARNYLIIEGCEKVVALPRWKRGKPEGGTAQGIRLAKELNIPVEEIGQSLF